MKRINYLGSYEVNINEIKIPKFFFLPNSKFKQFWDGFILMISLYSSMLLPLELGMFLLYKLKAENLLAFYLYFDYFISGCLLIDLIFNFRTAIYTSNGKIIVNPQTIAKDYTQKFFVIDFLSIWPLDFIFNKDMEIINFSILLFMKVPRLIRFIKIGRMLFNFQQTFMKISRMFFIYYLIAHYCSCAICYTDFVRVSGDKFSTQWIQQTASTMNILTLYSRYVNLSILILVGNNETPQDFTQRIIFVVMFYIGTLCDAIIFGSMTIIFFKTNFLEKNKIKRRDEMTMLLNTLDIEEKMKNEIMDFHEIIYWKNRDHYFTKNALKDLNNLLRTRVDLLRFSEIYFHVEDFSNDFVLKFTSKLKQRLTHPYDILTAEGRVDQGIFFVGKQGKFSVKVNGTNIKFLTEGDFFGEISFFLKSHRRIASVVSFTISIVYYLDGSVLRELFYDFPIEAKEFFKIALQRFEESKEYFDEDMKKKITVINKPPSKKKLVMLQETKNIWEDDILVMLKNCQESKESKNGKNYKSKKK